MIDLGFAALLSLVCLGVGKRILDRFGQAPEHPFDAMAQSLPLGMGLMALGCLALGELGWLNRPGLAALLAMLIELGIVPSFRLLRELGGRTGRARRTGRTDRSAAGRLLPLVLGTSLLGTAMVAMGPVTDGDALCYHLQVPKVFLMRGSVGFDPNLHETVYPLVTELIYAPALEFRGPVVCRWLAWALGLTFAANVTALARPSLGCRAWWAGTIAMLVPAVSNGMSAPLNDVSLASFGTAALFAWTRFFDRPSMSAAVVAGIYAGLAIGVKYPALVLWGLLGAATLLGGLIHRSRNPRPGMARWLAMAAVYAMAAISVGGWWYLRAYHHTGNPVYPFFRQAFGSGLDEVLDPIKRPMAVTAWNLLLALGPLSLQPDRFDSFSHQFGPVFLLFLPAALLERLPRRVLGLAGLAYLFLLLCLTQRQSTRFVLIALGPLSIAVAAGASAWCDRKTVAARLTMAVLLAVLGLEAGLALARSRHVLGLVVGRESALDVLARREPTYVVGQWVARNLPATARLIGQDHRGFYMPRPYAMELAHRRRTGLGRQGESPGEIVARLRQAGFTHVMLCPPVPETAVEFDPTLGRLLEPWLAGRPPIYRADLTDGDGILRRYAIYELSDDRLAAQPPGGLTR
jgi:hypothetical protein